MSPQPRQADLFSPARIALMLLAVLAIWLAGCGGGGDMADDEVEPISRERPMGVPQPGDLFVSPFGDDANPGTQASPRRRIDVAAASLAGTGRTVWLLDGTYTPARQRSATSVVIPTGVSVQALNPLAAVLRLRLELQGGNRLEGIKFDSVRPAITATKGTSSLVDLRFADNPAVTTTTAAMIEASGSASVELRGAGPAFDFIDAGTMRLARATDKASIAIASGRVISPRASWLYGAENAIFVAAASSTLSLTDVRVAGSPGLTNAPDAVIEALGNARVQLLRVTIDGRHMLSGSDPLYGVSVGPTGSTTIDIDASSFSRMRAAVVTSGDVGTKSTVRLKNSELGGGSNVGLLTFGQGDHDITVQGVLFGGGGIEHGLKLESMGFTRLDIRDSRFEAGVSTAAVEHGDWGGSRYGPLSLRMRNTRVEANKGLWLAAHLGQALDFGTVADPGNNVFRAGPDGCGLRLVNRQVRFAATTVQAVGNTWHPFMQGTNARGRYTATSGTAYGRTGPVACAPRSALNFGLEAGVTLRLAEGP